MAGIGFALKRLSAEENLLSRAASMGHAAVVAAGPWIFTILSLGLITLATEPVAGLQTLETFRCAVIYAFAISLVTTSPVAIITTRLVGNGPWVLQQGPAYGGQMLAIPGTTRLEHLLDNLGAAGVTLSPDLARRAAACMSGIQGERYAAATFAEIDSD